MRAHDDSRRRRALPTPTEPRLTDQRRRFDLEARALAVEDASPFVEESFHPLAERAVEADPGTLPGSRIGGYAVAFEPARRAGSGSRRFCRCRPEHGLPCRVTNFSQPLRRRID